MRCARWIATLATAGLIVAVASPASARFRPELYASIVVDTVSGEVLYERNADARRYPASLTKMMTLYLTFAALNDGTFSPDTKLTVSRHAAAREPSRLGLRPGERINVREAILALTTKSANDAATVLAEGLAGSEANFGLVMTLKSHELGMTSTAFRNASGLPHNEQATSARDIATLARALMSDFPEHYHYFSAPSFTFRGVEYPNQNRFLSTYPGADGLKTGYIRASGHNLAASASQGGRRLITVVFGGPTLAWSRQHAADLMDDAFATLDQREQLGVGQAIIARAPEKRTATAGRSGSAALAAAREAARAATRRTTTSPSAPRVARAAAGASASARGRVAPRKQAAPPTQAAEPSPATPTASDLLPRMVAGIPSAASPGAGPTVATPPPLPPMMRIDVVDRGDAPALPSVSSRTALPPPPPAAPQPSGQSIRTASRPTAPSADPADGWAVQLGIFANVATAQQRAEIAVDRLPGPLKPVKVVISSAGEGGRARSVLTQLDEERAREACSALQERQVPCIVIPPGRNVYVSKRAS